MRGRMTMEQAKAIKQKRELAKELGAFSFPFSFCLSCTDYLTPISEDVQEFAKAVEAKADRSRANKSLRKIESSGSEGEREDSNDNDNEESDVVLKRPVSPAVRFYFPL
jgi:hypothetical protein